MAASASGTMHRLIHRHSADTADGTAVPAVLMPLVLRQDGHDTVHARGGCVASVRYMTSLESQLYSLIGQAPNRWGLHALVQCAEADKKQVRACLKALEGQEEIRSEPGGYRIVPNDERPVHQRRPDNITIHDLTFDAGVTPSGPC